MMMKKQSRKEVEILASGRNASSIGSVMMVAPLKPTQEKRALRDEQQVLRLEILMMKGVQAKHQLMELLGIADYRQLDRYIKRVHARWELEGATSDLRRERGEGLQRLDMIESELWTSLSNTGDQRVKQKALKNLMRLQRLRNDMTGLRTT